MSTSKMLINFDHPEECRAVIVEDGKIEEYIVEHSGRELIKGNVYHGVIGRVEPSIEAAFVDYGGKKFGFLPFKDVDRSSYVNTGEKKSKVRIQDVLFSGQKILVQVVKEERETKGPTLSNSLSIPGRFLVLMSGSDSTGVSRKIEDEEERKKLKKILAQIDLPDNMGVIIRTAGLGRTKTDLQKDLQMLNKIWATIATEEKKNSEKNSPALLYKAPDMVLRTVRDHFTAEIEEILIDNPKEYKEIKSFFRMIMPRMGKAVKLYQGKKPLFSQYNIEQQIESFYKRQVNLPSGGSLVIDVGEALTAIDVNSGKTTGASQLEETAFKTNMEAATEVARQLRLRDLGGLVVVDFIDMYSKKNKASVEKQFKQACKEDKARINLARISKFGLLELSRQRMSPPVKEGAFDRCPHCEGNGQVKSDATMGIAVLRKIQELSANENAQVIEARVSSEISNYLLNTKLEFLAEYQKANNLEIRFVIQPGLKFEDFDFKITEYRKIAKKEPESAPRERVKADRSVEPPKERVKADRRGEPPKERVKADKSVEPPKERVKADKSVEPPKERVKPPETVEPQEVETVGDAGNTETDQDESKAPEKAVRKTAYRGRRPKSATSKRASPKAATGPRSATSRAKSPTTRGRRGRPRKAPTAVAEAKASVPEGKPVFSSSDLPGSFSSSAFLDRDLPKVSLDGPMSLEEKLSAKKIPSKTPEAPLVEKIEKAGNSNSRSGAEDKAAES